MFLVTNSTIEDVFFHYFFEVFLSVSPSSCFFETLRYII